MASKVRIGSGFDIHRLVPKRKLILGGIHVPFDLGLEGHSDGDVLIHAIIDALLGAAALGDIGIFFPSDDQRFAQADSQGLLVQVRDLIRDKNYMILNVDSIIISERPKLAPHYGQMQANLSSILMIEPEQINVKAKTAEGLGDIGSGKAIAAQASALLELQD
jgi:2-C-methyl-D-erythritol 2,4-cyclodiphosphate synthase